MTWEEHHKEFPTPSEQRDQICSEYEAMKAQKDRIVAREKAAIEAPLREQISQLTRERDEQISETLRLGTENAYVTAEIARLREKNSALLMDLTSAEAESQGKEEELDRLREQEQEACKYLFDLTNGQIGCGEEPIRVLIAQHAWIDAELDRMRRALEDIADGKGFPRLDAARALNPQPAPKSE